MKEQARHKGPADDFILPSSTPIAPAQDSADHQHNARQQVTRETERGGGHIIEMRAEQSTEEECRETEGHNRLCERFHRVHPFFLLMIRPPPRSTLFPYTMLSSSRARS